MKILLFDRGSQYHFHPSLLKRAWDFYESNYFRVDSAQKRKSLLAYALYHTCSEESVPRNLRDIGRIFEVPTKLLWAVEELLHPYSCSTSSPSQYLPPAKAALRLTTEKTKEISEKADKIFSLDRTRNVHAKTVLGIVIYSSLGGKESVRKISNALGISISCLKRNKKYLLQQPEVVKIMNA